MTQDARPVASFLAASGRARVLGHVALGSERSAAIWANDDDRIQYHDPVGHTLSYYLHGGAGTWRVDGARRQGQPGTICVLPEGCDSAWYITAPFSFLHLYLPDSELRRAYAEIHDRDARLLDLAEVTYAAPEGLEAPLRALADAVRAGSAGAAELATSEVIAALLADPRVGPGRAAPVAGGLSPRRLHDLRAHIEAHLDQPLRLADLARMAGLSEFHFQRAFRASCGVSPHGWIAERRVARAKQMIRAGDPLAQIAVACGYASQSHLTRAFRAGTGVTPGAWRRAVR